MSSDFVQPTVAIEQLTRPDVIAQIEPKSFKINNFDLIRLFAALQVAVFHSYLHFGLQAPAYLTPFGWFQGVPIFFMISGFLISASLERNSDMWAYARNRALRIFPALWTLLLIISAVTIGCGYHVVSLAGLVWFATQLCGIIFTPHFLERFGTGSYGISLWTIPIELQFYIALPITYYLFVRNRKSNIPIICVFAIFLIFSVILSFIFPDMYSGHNTSPEKIIRYTFAPRYYLFMLGVVFQKTKMFNNALIRGKGFYWVLAYAAFMMLVPQVGSVYIADELLMVTTVLSLAYTVPAFSERSLRGNDISYGVYLYHGLVINLMVEMHVVRRAWNVPAVILAAIALGYLSWIAIERPVIRRKRSTRKGRLALSERSV